jgi:hypothetical protein
MQSRKSDTRVIEEKIQKLDDIDKSSSKRELGTVLAAGYGSYESDSVDDIMKLPLTEDWSLLRVKSYRVGKNAFPNYGDYEPKFTGSADIEVGTRVVMNGSVTRVQEGIVLDRIMNKSHEHGKTYCWVVKEKCEGMFSQDGDSGSPIGLMNGLAGGTLISGGLAQHDDGKVFQISFITGITETLRRIEEVTGRKLEIPSEYNLSRSVYRDRHHWQETGSRRRRER